MIFDITTKEKSIETLVNYLHIDEKEFLNYLDHHSFDFDVHDFLKNFHIEAASLPYQDLSLVAFHLTSSNNECEDFTKHGIMGVKDVIKVDNAISIFLKEQEIYFNDTYTAFDYHGVTYNIEKFNLYQRLVEENHVHCFLSVDDTGYFSEQLQVRPDIITLISEIVNDSSIKDIWDVNHTTYMIKFYDELTSFDLESISNTSNIDEAILELILFAVDMILFNGHVEISVWTKKDHIIDQSKIIYIRDYYNN